jgi:hypothetical protein
VNAGASVPDAASLDALRELGGDQFVGDLIGMFLADAPPRFAGQGGGP